MNGANPGHGALNRIAGNDDSVFKVAAPALKKLSRQSTLHHTWAGHHHGGSYVVEMVYALKQNSDNSRAAEKWKVSGI